MNQVRFAREDDAAHVKCIEFLSWSIIVELMRQTEALRGNQWGGTGTTERT